MVGRGELTESAWATMEPLLPRSGGRGGQWRDHRTVINGILWKLRTGAPWRDLARSGAICRSATGRGRRAQIGSIAGDVRDSGIVSSPTCRPNQLRWGRWSGKSVSTARPRGRTSMPVALGIGGARPLKKGDLAPGGRSPRTQPGRAERQVSSGL
jgi:transposase